MARTAWARVGAFFLRLGMSAAVMTARTPGSALAREVSMRLIRACACGLRSSLACSMPLGLRSATYSVRPVTFSAPSARGIESPTPFTPRVVFITVAMASTPPSRRGGGCLRDRGDHLRVPGAPAQIAGDPVTNLLLRGVTVLAEQGGRGHQHPGDAETALGHAVTDERVLQRMERAVSTQPLDGPDRTTASLHGQHETARDRLAVEMDGAGAAIAGAAAFLGADQPQVFAQRVQQRVVRPDEHLDGFVVDGAAQNLFHHVAIPPDDVRRRPGPGPWSTCGGSGPAPGDGESRPSRAGH